MSSHLWDCCHSGCLSFQNSLCRPLNCDQGTCIAQGTVHNSTIFNYIFRIINEVDYDILYENDKTVHTYIYCRNNFQNLPWETSLEETGFLSRGRDKYWVSVVDSKWQDNSHYAYSFFLQTALQCVILICNCWSTLKQREQRAEEQITYNPLNFWRSQELQLYR